MTCVPLSRTPCRLMEERGSEASAGPSLSFASARTNSPKSSIANAFLSHDGASGDPHSRFKPCPRARLRKQPRHRRGCAARRRRSYREAWTSLRLVPRSRQFARTIARDVSTTSRSAKAVQIWCSHRRSRAAPYLNDCIGYQWPEFLAAAGREILQTSPLRVVVNPIGRIEVFTPIPLPGARTPPGPHTHFLPALLAAGRESPPGMELPRRTPPVCFTIRPVWNSE
jgi:hypothetical protein